MNSQESFCWIYFSVFTILIVCEKSCGLDPKYVSCAPQACGKHNIRFPFYIKDQQEPYCGYPGFELNCSSGIPIIHIPDNYYVVEEILYKNHSLRLQNLDDFLSAEDGCFSKIQNVTLSDNDGQFSCGPNVSELYLLSNCSKTLPGNLSSYRVSCGGGNVDEFGLAMFGNDRNLNAGLAECRRSVIAPVEYNGSSGVGRYQELLREGFALNWKAQNCSRCERSGGRCGFDSETNLVMCYCSDRPHLLHCSPKKGKLKVVLLATVIPGVLIICLVIIGTYLRKQGKPFIYFRSRNTTSDPSSKPGLEGSSVFFGVPVFSYNELEEATDNFHSSKQLGDGGFGTVYHGKLQDGREVAVKRLYEHNYKRVEQFMNEIEILTRLRHRNLVTLYGCTSRHSRELLLVYEYIPNGTVGDHLHGDKANEGSLTWPIRMKIAIETASALAYLHASDIIHRDVKTNNILLDNNFCVKVADFGLSRLFPNDVSHVSTAPQGTPGYVDPEYYQCYQLTDKSDVYSFGVVLVELISSLPAVDISRHRHEINLANLAINRIQRCEFSELIDSNLGFEIDAAVKRMTTSVAELTFRCLQHEKEMRPSMDEVLEALQEIQNYESELEQASQADGSVGISRRATKPPFSPESDNLVLLKNSKLPPSPNSVADNSWVSSSTATSSSG